MIRSTNRLALVLAICAMALLGAAQVFGGSQTEQPATQVQSSGTQYISPNGDEVQDAGEITFAVTIFVKSDQGYIPEYGVRMLDASGDVVREIVEQQESDLGWFARIFRRYEAFTLERSMMWDGTDAGGVAVADGEYSLEMWVIDPQEQREAISLDSFIVDTAAPTLSVSIQEPAIFSPNGDGKIDTYSITLADGTIEDSWSGEIVDVDDNVVTTYSWVNRAPASFIWGGNNDSGELTVDGAHRFRIAATDRAGNAFSAETAEFQLATIETPLYVTLDGEYISPNGDGVQDTLTASISQEISDDITEWSLVVDDGEGNVVRRYGAQGMPPEEIVFDGAQDSGEPAREDVYRVVYSVRYRNGNSPFVVSELFAIDLTEPEIEVDVTRRLISPNGDGRLEETNIWFKSNEIVTWSGEITDSDGNVVQATDSTRTTSLIVWRGTDTSGNTAADGVYTLEARFTDVAGNTHEIPSEEIELDATPPVVTFELDKDYFSPDGDGIKDTLIATFTSSEPVRGRLELADAAGRTVGTLGGFGQSYQLIDGRFIYEWGGITGTGLYINDGSYTVSSSYEDHSGNRITLDDLGFIVDTRTVSLAASAPLGFSPNGDGTDDTITVEVDANFYDTVDAWSLSFVDGSGKVLRKVEGSETLPDAFTWDGAMQFADSAIKAPEGLYRGVVEVSYRKGNDVTAETDFFFIDVTPPAVNLKATADPFAQANGNIEGDVYITLQIDDAHEVEDWSMDILSQDDEIVRSFVGTGDFQDQIVWKDDRGEVVTTPTTELMVVRVGVVDEVGNFATFEQVVPLDIVVVNRDGKLYLMVPNVIFGAYKHDLDSRGDEQLQRNLESITRVAEIYEKYPDHRLVLEGHALNIYRGEPEREAEEEVLVPLTERRATTVASALVESGLPEETITVEWYGGTQPIVDVHDREIRWKNRRVEFIMRRPDRP